MDGTTSLHFNTTVSKVLYKNMYQELIFLHSIYLKFRHWP